MEKLKICPFCGCEFMDILHDHPEENKSTDWIIECRRCLAMGPSEETREKAIKAWNTRIDE